MNEDVRALQDALENLNHAQKTMCIKNDFNRYLFLSRHLENSDFKPDELCITSWLPFFYLCHFELPLGILLNRRELWGRFGWLKNTCQWFFNHIKKYNKWWLSNTKQRILFLWHHFKSTLQHHIKDFKISSHWFLLPLNFNCTVPRTVTSSKGLWITWILSSMWIQMSAKFS